MTTEENIIHIGTTLANYFCFIVFPLEAFDFNINVEFLVNLLRKSYLVDTLFTTFHFSTSLQVVKNNVLRVIVTALCQNLLVT